MSRPLADRDSAPWWQALTQRRLLVQECSTCPTLRFAPRAMCNRCGSFDWTWREAAGAGTVASWTVSHRSLQAGRSAPYVVLLVRLNEADNLLLPGGWSGESDGSDLTMGMAVVADYADIPTADPDANVTLLNWRAQPS